MVCEPPLGVVVVDPLPVVRAALALIVDEQPDMDVLAEARTTEEVLDAIRRIRRSPACVLVGLGIEGEHDSYWLIRTILKDFPGLSVVACGANADPLSISRALFSGAAGFLDQSSDPVEFIRSLRKIATGGMVPAGLPSKWVGAITQGIEGRHSMQATLTEREREVLTVAAEGLTARQMASRLGVSERTVTTHLSRIYGKLGVGSRVAAIRRATDAGLVPVEMRG